MNSLRAEHAVDLYRYKGVVCVRERSGGVKRAVLQGVHDMCMFEPRGTWPAGSAPTSQIVFIGGILIKIFGAGCLRKRKRVYLMKMCDHFNEMVCLHFPCF